MSLLARLRRNWRLPSVEMVCSTALMSKRVQAIEAIMKRPIEELRLLGRELGEMSARSSSRRGGKAQRNRDDRDFEEEEEDG